MPRFSPPPPLEDVDDGLASSRRPTWRLWVAGIVCLILLQVVIRGLVANVMPKPIEERLQDLLQNDPGLSQPLGPTTTITVDEATIRAVSDERTPEQ